MWFLINCGPQGYTRDTSFLEMVVDIIQELKKANPSLVYGEYQECGEITSTNYNSIMDNITIFSTEGYHTEYVHCH